jgi:hypothetical protein
VTEKCNLVSDPIRSYERFLPADLQRLAEIAKRDRDEFFLRNPKYTPLKSCVLGVALCQGAALHYVDGRNGIKDIDVWTFYASCSGLKYPWRRPVASYDFGDPKFGITSDSPHFIGRRVDCLGRSLNDESTNDPVNAIRHYLAERRTRSAAALAEKAVVMIEPYTLLGLVVWPVSASGRC